MAAVKLIVIYPTPKDIDAFEKVYQEEHIPMAVQKLAGKTRLVATKAIASPQGTPAFHRIAEIHFSSMDALQSCLNSPAGKKRPLMQSGFLPVGRPIMFIAEEQSLSFDILLRDQGGYPHTLRRKRRHSHLKVNYESYPGTEDRWS